MPVLIARGAGVRRRRGWLFRDLDVTIEPGELVAIVGPPGSGRTTAALALARRFRLAAGRVELTGRASLGYVPDVSAPEPVFTVAEHVRERLALLGRSRRRSVRLHGLDPQRQGQDLSPYEKQLLGLVLAQLADPAVIALDGFDDGLDAREQESLWQLLTSLAAGGVAVIVTAREVDGSRFSTVIRLGDSTSDGAAPGESVNVAPGEGDVAQGVRGGVVAVPAAIGDMGVIPGAAREDGGATSREPVDAGVLDKDPPMGGGAADSERSGERASAEVATLQVGGESGAADPGSNGGHVEVGLARSVPGRDRVSADGVGSEPNGDWADAATGIPTLSSERVGVEVVESGPGGERADARAGEPSPNGERLSEELSGSAGSGTSGASEVAGSGTSGASEVPKVAGSEASSASEAADIAGSGTSSGSVSGEVAGSGADSESGGGDVVAGEERVGEEER
ncbi:ATP-binding cassette domain-containing protein [Actinoplanes bogorensis]|uniref:ATP-binding cassette domain-containing protein n=1 Tax=Paractinoplanes bogorensis TaxID=1610840 RepID=A0ABS5YFX2_9ACTN|nr:ATP-binding cassette domain-containing protein [Actinoplanes bogorensis]MBU2662221.1 ATP-binding cassette domain-containing protein [Actinoplanes bogorensis]